MTSVKNISEFLSSLNAIHKSLRDKKYEVFFRGHPDASYKIIPKIYRDKNKIKPNNEHKLFANTEIKYPEAFIAQSSTFEKMSLMQHYGLSTRLLDLTENALVALYFACIKNDCNAQEAKKDGAVLCFGIKESIIKYYNSDSVSVICAISKLPDDKIKKIADEFSLKLENLKSDPNAKSYPNILQLLKKKPTGQTILESTRNRTNFNPTELKLIQDTLNDCTSMKFIIHEIGHEKPHFKPEIHMEDFDNRILCVKSKLNNDRIKAQSGLFLLFGIRGADKSKPPIVEQSQHKDNITYEQIIIDNSSKQAILNDLKILGINTGSIFPGISSSSDAALLNL